MRQIKIFFGGEFEFKTILMSNLASPKFKNINAQNSSFISGYLTKSSFLSNSGIPTWYHNLPVEVLIKIFKHFDERELRTCLALVCKRWKFVSFLPDLWKTFEVYGKNVPIYFICRKIRDLTELEGIYLTDILEPIAVIRQICRCLPNIKHVAIRNCGVIPETVLRNLILCCKNLETLDLGGTKFRANRFYEEIAGLMNLKSVNLSKNSSLSVQNLLSVVLNCHKLEELNLSIFCPIQPAEQLSDEDASFIIWTLAPTLKTLILDSSTLTNFSFKAIMSCNRLEKLGLYGAGNLSAEIFINIWKHLPKLKSLIIRHAHHITGEDISELFISGKDVMKQITSIDFTGCWKITDVGIEAIANCCKELESLILKSCKNICSLLEVRNKCGKLMELNIAFCTNLDLNTILPLPPRISTIILDKTDNFSSIIESESFKIKKINIKLCLSEYNTDIENYTFK